MERILFWFDYTFGYIMTNPRNLPFYHRAMWERYGELYCTEEQFHKYWDEAEYAEDWNLELSSWSAAHILWQKIVAQQFRILDLIS